MSEKNNNFEENLIELENIVKQLESSQISLDEAVKNYTKGIELSKKCYDILNESEELVVKKMTESGLVDFK